MDLFKAITLNPYMANPHKHLGSIFFHQGKLQLALDELSEAINLNDQYIEAYKERAKVYHCLGEEDLAKKDEIILRELEAN